MADSVIVVPPPSPAPATSIDLSEVNDHNLTDANRLCLEFREKAASMKAQLNAVKLVLQGEMQQNQELEKKMKADKDSSTTTQSADFKKLTELSATQLAHEKELAAEVVELEALVESLRKKIAELQGDLGERDDELEGQKELQNGRTT